MRITHILENFLWPKMETYATKKFSGRSPNIRLDHTEAVPALDMTGLAVAFRSSPGPVDLGDVT